MAKIKKFFSAEDSNWQRMLLKHKRTAAKPLIQIAQNPLGMAGGLIANGLQTIGDGEILEGTTIEGLSLMNYTKFWRMKLLMKSTPMAKTEYSPRPLKKQPNNLKNEHYTYTLSPAEKESAEVQKIAIRRKNDGDPQANWEARQKSLQQGQDIHSSKFNFTKVREEAAYKSLRQASNLSKNEIIIVNDNVSPYLSLVIQNRPNELRITPQSTWVNIVSAGRNNPFMMYTGGEDTVSFDISWYASDPSHREEVIAKCKLLESWTRANGYLASPPVLQIIWGQSNIFKDQRFVLESASYILTHFQDQARQSRKKVDGKDPYGEIQDLKLYPNYATQSLTFKKVTAGNTSHSDIIDLNALKSIQGIRTK